MSVFGGDKINKTMIMKVVFRTFDDWNSKPHLGQLKRTLPILFLYIVRKVHVEELRHSFTL